MRGVAEERTARYLQGGFDTCPRGLHFNTEEYRMDIAALKDFSIVVGGLVTIFAFANGLLEYRRQGAQKRVEHFTMLRRRLKENPVFKEICALMLAHDPRLAEIDAQDKRDFIGLLEEVALQVNSGLIRHELAHYMFGYYTIKCLESKDFWANLTLDETYWNLFHDFAREMKAKEISHTYKRDKLRF